MSTPEPPLDRDRCCLIGAQITADRGSQIAWVKRDKPFDYLARR